MTTLVSAAEDVEAAGAVEAAEIGGVQLAAVALALDDEAMVGGDADRDTVERRPTEPSSGSAKVAVATWPQASVRP